MKSKRYTTEQIISDLRKVDVIINQGKTVSGAIREIGVTEMSSATVQNTRIMSEVMTLWKTDSQKNCDG